MNEPRGMSLRKFVAPEVIFGIGARKLAGQYARNLGARKVLLVTDPGVISAGWAGHVEASLAEEGLKVALFSGVTPNPRAEEVMAGAEVYESANCNAIVGVGGGSPMDCAKGIGIVSSNHRSIFEFEGVDKVAEPMPPLICIPTTGGTSADVSQFAIITNLQEKLKFAVISKAVVPDVSLIDPVTLTTMSPYLAACTGIDALAHAIEAFVSSAHSTITDVHALEAIRLINDNLLASLEHRDDLGLLHRVMEGSLQAGLAFSNASLGGVHAMAHSVGGLRDLPHGECNAMLLEHVMAFNYPQAASRYERVGQVMGLDLRGMNTRAKRNAVLSRVRRLSRAAGLVQTLGQQGVARGDIPDLAGKALKDPCMVTNPRRPNTRDIEVIYEEAL